MRGGGERRERKIEKEARRKRINGTFVLAIAIFCSRMKWNNTGCKKNKIYCLRHYSYFLKNKTTIFTVQNHLLAHSHLFQPFIQLSGECDYLLLEMNNILYAQLLIYGQ